MQRMPEADVLRVVDRLPNSVVGSMMAFCADSDGRCGRLQPLFLAGGFIRAVLAGEEPADIDLFTADRIRAEAAAQVSRDAFNAAMFEGERVITVTGGSTRIQMQFVSDPAYTSPEAVINSFDFTVCQAVIWNVGAKGNRWGGMVGDEFYEHLKEKRLVYSGSGNPVGTVSRVLKYVRRGYKIAPADYAAILANLYTSLELGELDPAEDNFEAVLHASLTNALGRYRRNLEGATNEEEGWY